MEKLNIISSPLFDSLPTELNVFHNARLISPKKTFLILLRIYSQVEPSDRAVEGVGLAAACLLELWVQIPSEAWMSFCCVCCVL
jgi:hypothetical protein